MHNKSNVTLPVLNFQDFQSQSKVSGKYSTIFRQGGIRLEQEQINEKNIYHNYGQGQSQLSLAYGCAYIVSKMITLKKQETKTKNVAVIGSGINALMTTLQLIKRGHRVTLYSKHMPMTKNKDGTKEVLASQGLQFWYPGDYDNCDPLKHQLVSKLSFQFLTECLKSNRYQSLRHCNVYLSNDRADDLKQNITDFITRQTGQVTVNFGNQKLQQFAYFKSILIDSQLFIEQIFTELKLRNFNIVIKKFETLQDVLSLEEQFIYNCLGTEIKKLFNDEKAIETVNQFYTLNKQFKQIKSALAIWKSSQSVQTDDFVVIFTPTRLQISFKKKLMGGHPEAQKEINKKLTKVFYYLKQRTNIPAKL